MPWVQIAADLITLVLRLLPESDPAAAKLTEARGILLARAAADAEFAARTHLVPPP